MFKKGSMLLLLPLILLFVSGCGDTGVGLVSSLLGGGGVGLLGGTHHDSEGDSSGDYVGALSFGTSGNPGSSGGDDASVLTHTPEPGSLLLFGTGLLGSALARSRFRNFFRKKKIRKIL